MQKEEQKFAPSLVFEGMTSIRAVLESSSRKIEKILFDRAKSESKYKEIRYLQRISEQYGFTVEAVDSAVIDEITVGSSHGGIIAYCSDRQFPALKEISLENNGFYMMLEGIEDPYNFGYAMRSVYAAGADGIILSPRNWMSAAGVVCRASAGASERFKIYISDAEEAIDIFRKSGYKIVCADTKDSVSVYETDLKKPIFMIVGGEKRGISRKVLDCADKIVRLDYGREFKAALSAASAASILAFEVFRQTENKK